MKGNKFLPIVSILTLIVLLLGATFAYFGISTFSDENAVSGNAAVFDIALNVSPLYTGKALIPTNDTDIEKAIENHCVDIYGNGACVAYDIELENNGQDMDYAGEIEFHLSDVVNLKYLVLDEEGNEYKEPTTIVSDTSQSLGNSISLADGETGKLTLVIWLPNMQYPQNDDENGNFTALITFSSSAGSRVTGTFSN